MAVRRNQQDFDQQLDLFSTRRPTHDNLDPIRPDGRETLARTPSENGARTGTEGIAATDAPGGGGKDEGRNGHAANGFDATGGNGTTSADPGLGNGAGKIHPAPHRRILADGHRAERQHRHQQEDPPKNLNSYRIAEADRLGEGGPKQKFQRNFAAIQTLRTLAAGERPATEKEKATLVKYVGWGALPQVFDVDNRDWHKEQIQ